MAAPTRQNATVFVGGLDVQVSESTLHDAFIPFGEIVSVSLPKPDLPSNRDPHRGFGYVEFSEAEDAREAIDNMDQAEFFGRVIKVNQAKPQKDANEGLGSRTAVWEQEGYASKYNVSDEDKFAADSEVAGQEDPMQGLESLAEAGPQQQ